MYNGKYYEIEKVSKSDKAYKITLTIPEELQTIKKDTYRNYYILRNYNGELNVLNAYDNGDGTITFESDKFSTYALAYENIQVPNTYDNITISLIMSVIALMSIIVIGYSLKKIKRIQ